jgi:hypothetical protein
MRAIEGLSNRRFHVRGLSIALLACAVLSAVRSEGGTFGTRCQQSFQNGWRETLPYTWDHCAGFNDELDDSDTKKFYFDLNTTGLGFVFNDDIVDFGGVDSVDLFYIATHGGAKSSTTDARLALWGEQMRTFSSNWRFGDNARKVKIFSQYACETLWIDDFSFARWAPAFKGGLYIATGSHDKVYAGWTTEETGEDYADDLQHGKSVKWAWLDGNSDWAADQDVAVYASSSGPLSECKSRRDSMTWQNIGGFTRFRDGNMNRLCASWISDN